ncbi:MAG: PspC domain-containing protein [Phycisphaeraceae bacterium]
MIDPARPLTRSTTDVMLGGVCAGLAKWLGWDVTLVRVIYVAVTAATGVGPGMIAYLVLWLIMPPEPTP